MVWHSSVEILLTSNTSIVSFLNKKRQTKIVAGVDSCFAVYPGSFISALIYFKMEKNAIFSVYTKTKNPAVSLTELQMFFPGRVMNITSLKLVHLLNILSIRPL